MSGKDSTKNTFHLSPIGYLHSSKQFPYEAARQSSVEDSGTTGVIKLVSGQHLDQALRKLDEFSHLWVIYIFHQNISPTQTSANYADKNTLPLQTTSPISQHNWKPLVLPPRSKQKQGVFATRAPYRPNAIGMSCVEIKKIDGLNIFIKNHDLLDGTPILDIKPYLTYTDSIPEARLGWVQNLDKQQYRIFYSSLAELQVEFLRQLGLTNFKAFIQAQLNFAPTDKKRKRIITLNEHEYQLSYRTWRIIYQIKANEVHVIKITSGYSKSDLSHPEDPYKDKVFHQQFMLKF